MFGTAFNTAGTAMQQVWDCRAVNSAGATAGVNSTSHGSASLLSYELRWGSRNHCFYHWHGDGRNPSILNSNQADLSPAPTQAAIPTHTAPTNASQPVGVGVTAANAFSFTTAAQTCNGISFGSGGGVPTSCGFILNLTTPVVLPSGTFSGTWFQQWQFTRQLV